jgi:hypothetical protein
MGRLREREVGEKRVVGQGVRAVSEGEKCGAFM